MDRVRIARLINFDDEDTSTGYVDVTSADPVEPIKTVEELTDYLYDFLLGKCSVTVYTENEFDVRCIDVLIGFTGAVYDYYIRVDDYKCSDTEIIRHFVRTLGYIAKAQDLKTVASECGGMRGFCQYTPKDDKYLADIRNWCREMYSDLRNRV